MKTREIVRKFFLIAFPVFMIVVAYEFYANFIRNGEISSGVSRVALLSIVPGQSEAEVRRALGRPLKEEIYELHNTFPGHPEKTMLYGSPNFIGKGLEININILDGVVDNVLLEEDDLGVYWYNRKDGRVMKNESVFNKYITK